MGIMRFSRARTTITVNFLVFNNYIDAFIQAVLVPANNINIVSRETHVWVKHSSTEGIFTRASGAEKPGVSQQLLDGRPRGFM